MKKAIPFGKYDLLERINVGGMAEVFRAKAYGVEGFERLVAVKRILPNIAEDKEFTTMLRDEANIAVQLSHANIAQIYEFGLVEGSYFIALEHIHGRDLRAMFERCRSLGAPMPVAQVCFIVMKLCEGLDYAHNKRDAQGRDMNLVHRDVSPQNVLVSFEGEVKIIDFGIVKAAGKVGKTQAGILKGKFGYMSPEQVRGLPVDRRSDIFATGIVLYELLTNERLFVGETDFSTLEKVRNVEILPPSTYNRKIPDELERIVLKALARDMDDRYTNAIDLHDELQAFVYTAGEFYSRKDLAAWMKRNFAKEIEEEAAKIDGYRQLAPGMRKEGEAPPVETLRGRVTGPHTVRAGGSAQKVTQGIRKATISMPAAVPPPAPTNGRGRQTRPPVPVFDDEAPAVGRSRPTRPPPFEPEAPPRNRQTRPPVFEPEETSPAAPPAPQTDPEITPAPAEPLATLPDRKPRRGDLEWDDEELETQIYDSAGPPPPVVKPAQPSRRASSASPAFVTAPTVPQSDNIGSPAAVGAKTFGSGTPVVAEKRRERRPRPAANGSSPSFSAAREPSMTARGTIIPEIHVRRPPSPGKLWLIAALGAVVVGAMIVGGYSMLSGDGKPSPATAARTQAEPTQAAPQTVDPNSGFDITTDPVGGKVRLDGNEIGNAPLRVRSLLAGKHNLEVGGVAGYQALKQEIVVEQGKAATIAVKLEKDGSGAPSSLAVTPSAPVAAAPAVAVLKLTSEPPGARVTLVVDGQRTVLGVTPAEARVDTGRPSEVVFELGGHAPVTKAITAGDTTIAAVLVPEHAAAVRPPAAVVAPPKEIAAPVAARSRERERDKERERAEAREREKERAREKARERDEAAARRRREREELAERPAPRETTPQAPRETTPEAPRETTPGPRVTEVAPAGNGKLTLGSKPPCSVLVDGKDTGRTTPLRELELPSGKATITLVNAEYGIRESFTVNVKPGETTKVIKDYSDRIPQ